jgi:hypothetical protein
MLFPHLLFALHDPFRNNRLRFHCMCITMGQLISLINTIMQRVHRTSILSMCNSLNENHIKTNLSLVLMLVQATDLPFCYFAQP